MNMNKKKLISTVAVIAMSLSIVFPTSAQENNFNNLDNNTTIKDFLENIGEKGNFADITILKDFDETNRYYYLPFSTGGYLIYDAELDLVHEYSEVEENKIIKGKKDIYYGGALSYFQQEEDQLIELPTRQKISTTKEELAEEIKDNKEIMMDKARKNNSIIARAKSTVRGTVPNYSYNPDGICGSTAAAMMLRWYDIYVNGKYVPTSLESSNGVALINKLRTYIDDRKRSSNTGDVFSGIMSYCSSQGISHPGGFDVITSDYIIGRVDTYGTPFIMGLTRHPKYGEHWVTGYGYNVVNGTFYAIVNDGWGSSGVSLNLINADYIIW